MAGADDKPDKGPARTVYLPPSAGAGAASIPPPPNSTRRIAAPKPPTQASPDTARLAIGVVLNHIYQVTRFIDRGGMGEVYEGINVNTDERVAIKVILPHLAEDPTVQAMFRKEARTLTRLNHMALVQYRVLAQEPQLHALYIVTEFVDGIGLDLLIGHVIPTEDQVRSLMRRLADGLKAAHDLGAIHRDISPDNILAPEGRLDQAKIIDFGIAKDLQTSQATIVGAGFAGKLGFVAPEQFGDFDRQIGPWTDVYSLGLVMLAFATGTAPDMGTTLVEAVDKRRSGPDLSKLPPTLKPIFTGMLAADPQKRFRSMDEVLAALDKRTRSRAASKPPVAEPVPAATDARPARTRSTPPKPKTSPPPKARSELKLAPPTRSAAGAIPRSALIIAGVVFLGVLVIGLAAMLLFPHKPADVTTVTGGLVSGSAAPASDLARTVEKAVSGTDCAWLEYGPLGGDNGRVSLSLTGGAGDPDAAAGHVKQAIESEGRSVDLRQGDVKAIPRVACEAVNALRLVRAPAANGDVWLSTPQSLLRPDGRAECHNDPSYALAVIEGALGTSGEDAAMVVLGPDGQLRSVFNGAGALSRAAVTARIHRRSLDVQRRTLPRQPLRAAARRLWRGPDPRQGAVRRRLALDLRRRRGPDPGEFPQPLPRDRARPRLAHADGVVRGGACAPGPSCSAAAADGHHPAAAGSADRAAPAPPGAAGRAPRGARPARPDRQAAEAHARAKTGPEAPRAEAPAGRRPARAAARLTR